MAQEASRISRRSRGLPAVEIALPAPTRETPPWTPKTATSLADMNIKRRRYSRAMAAISNSMSRGPDLPSTKTANSDLAVSTKSGGRSTPSADQHGKNGDVTQPVEMGLVGRRVDRIKQYEEQHKEKVFMRRLYRDLDMACGDISIQENRDLLDLVRLARICEIYDYAPRPYQKVYRARLEGEGDRYEADPDAYRALNLLGVARLALSDLDDSNKWIRTRTSSFIQDHGMFTFVVCAHSFTFRRWMATNAFGDGEMPPETRRAVNELIRQNSASIEMFVRSRDLQWKEVVSKHNQFIEDLIEIIETRRSLFNNGDGLGYSRRRENLSKNSRYATRAMDQPLLKIPKAGRGKKEHGKLHPHQLALSLDERSMIVPEVEIPKYLANQTAEDTKQRLPSAKTKDQTVSVPVQFTGTSFLAPDYVWHNRDRWPIDDPCYRSPVSKTSCALCSSPPRPGEDSVFCSCTLPKFILSLRFKVPRYSYNPLLELRIYPTRGIGVRVLQPLYKGDILSEYVGELYPASNHNSTDSNNKGASAGKYIPGAGTTYQVAATLARREVPLPPPTTTAPGKARGRTKAKARAKASPKQPSPSPAPLPDDEHHNYVIDSARYGNWTRYINHSCNPSAQFLNIELGDKIILVVVMRRDLEWGEELTVDYGKPYWSSGRICKCGEEKCISGKEPTNNQQGQTEDNDKPDHQIPADADADTDTAKVITIPVSKKKVAKRKRGRPKKSKKPAVKTVAITTTAAESQQQQEGGEGARDTIIVSDVIDNQYDNNDNEIVIWNPFGTQGPTAARTGGDGTEETRPTSKKRRRK